MVLVDTSVWVSHLRATDTELVSLLAAEKVACHPFVIGELACGNLANRQEILALLQDLPPATTAQDHEVLSLIEARRLMGRGIGLVDVHLLASALLSPMPIWTRDRRLREAAVEMGISFD
jgi:predicted nucleic acid-binding protein